MGVFIAQAPHADRIGQALLRCDRRCGDTCAEQV